MKYLLDSNIVSDFYEPSSKSYPQLIAKFFELNAEDEVFISILTLYELEFGYENAPEPMKTKIRQKINEITADYQALPLMTAGISHFAKFKKHVRENIQDFVKTEDAKNPKDAMKQFNLGLMIAGTAIAKGAVLVSSDRIYPKLAEFFPTLRVENWAQ